jgi:predicted metalloprotease with PDZ domain
VRHRWPLFFAAWCLAGAAQADGTVGPQPAAPTAAIAAPEDVDFPGVVEVSVDATDLGRRIFRIHETLPVPPAVDLVLLYPKWLPGTHAPEGPLDRLAGLIVRVGGKQIQWVRDPVDVYAFHIAAPPGTTTVDVDFQYLSPVSHAVGRTEVTTDLLVLDWNAVVLYPAGYFARRIPVDVRLTLPDSWALGTALETASAAGPVTSFRRVSLETLVDSPVRAGRHLKRYDLAPGDTAPVHLDLLAERPDLLEIKSQVVDPLRALVQQAYKLFGSHHYDHYDFILSLSDTIGWDTTLEHHRSAEYGEPAADFADWDKTAGYRDVIAHEYTHSWDGKFRRPADLWTPNYNVPMRNSLLWVYEGGTEYWGQVLTARAGLWTKQQTLDSLAMMIAALEEAKGRSWRALQDTTADEIVNPRRPLSWGNWQRFEDYYEEGALIWLDADTLIRERSQSRRSLDDFARAFFSIENGSYTPIVYTFDDIVSALNSVEPYDWATFLRTRLDGHAAGAPLDGLHRGGYKLVFTETPSAYWTSVETTRTKSSDFTYSLGLVVDKEGALNSVAWDSPAFKAGLTAGTRLVAVNGIAWDPAKLREAVTLAKGQSAPIELLVRNDDRFRVVRVDYHDGLRYPHLERDASQPARLDDILAPRK